MTNSSLASVAQAAAGSGAGGNPAPATDAPKAFTMETLKTEHPDLFASISKTAREEGFAAGVAAENTRILAIEANALAGHDDLIKAHKADTAITPEKSAMAILSAEKAKPADVRKTLANMDSAAAGVESRPSEQGDGGNATQKATTPEGWKAEWETSDKLKAEFPTADAYVATMKRENRPAA
jgi:hypothetical protein